MMPAVQIRNFDGLLPTFSSRQSRTKRKLRTTQLPAETQTQIVIDLFENDARAGHMLVKVAAEPIFQRVAAPRLPKLFFLALKGRGVGGEGSSVRCVPLSPRPLPAIAGRGRTPPRWRRSVTRKIFNAPLVSGCRSSLSTV